MPSTRLLAFDDPCAYMASIRAAEVDLLPTAKGHFRAEVMQISLNGLWMQRGREDLPRIAQVATSTERVAVNFLTSLDQHSMCQGGIEVTPGDIIVHDSKPNHQRTDGPCQWASMSLTPEAFVAAGRTYAGRDLAIPSDARIVRPGAIQMSRLLRLHRRAGRMAGATPERPQAARALEQALVHALVTCLTEGVPTKTSAGERHHSTIIAKLEDFVSSRPGQPLHVAELCAATGASERTLRVCCQERFGMGPIRYLLLRRMNLANRALLAAAPMDTTVTEIATKYGFWELGRFSVAHRELFGESPSASLNRPADDRLFSGKCLFDPDDSEVA